MGIPAVLSSASCLIAGMALGSFGTWLYVDDAAQDKTEDIVSREIRILEAVKEIPVPCGDELGTSKVAVVRQAGYVVLWKRSSEPDQLEKLVVSPSLDTAYEAVTDPCPSTK